MKKLLAFTAFLTLWLMGQVLHAVKITTSDGQEFNFTITRS